MNFEDRIEKLREDAEATAEAAEHLRTKSASVNSRVDESTEGLVALSRRVSDLSRSFEQSQSEDSSEPLLDAQAELIAAQAALISAQSDTIDDITRRKNVCAQTGLPFLAGFKEELIGVYEDEEPDIRKSTGALFFDINGLALFNDTFSHDVGDEAIITTAEIIVGGIRAGDKAYRRYEGGDEFMTINRRLTNQSNIDLISERITTAADIALRGLYVRNLTEGINDEADKEVIIGEHGQYIQAVGLRAVGLNCAPYDNSEDFLDALTSGLNVDKQTRPGKYDGLMNRMQKPTESVVIDMSSAPQLRPA